MNQILYHRNSKLKSFFKMQFFVLIIALVLILLYYVRFRYDLYYESKISEDLLRSFGITKIYDSNNDYNAKLLSSDEIYFYKNSSFSVIGIIDIKKLNISYPILSDVNKDFLKISPCRFYGPMPNEIR